MSNNGTAEFRLYRPHILEINKDIPQTENSPYLKLTNQLIDIIFKRDLLVETGRNESSIKSMRADVQREVTQIIQLKTNQIDPQSEEGRRVKSLTKEIFEAIIQGDLLRSIHKDEYLSALALSIDLAIDPTLASRLVINTGFGGSDSPDINMRVPAYVLPGIKILENLYLIWQKNGWERHAPQLRVFFAPFAAIKVNGAEMNEELILKNYQKTLNFIQKYIERFHPQIANNVLYQVEKPWDEHDDLTAATLQYFSYLLLRSDNEDIIEVRRVLKERGVNHGGNSGGDLSYLYAASHSLLFKDGLNHMGHMFEDKDKPLFSISVGGRPERLFNTIRTFLRYASRIEELGDFVTGSTDVYTRKLQEVQDLRACYGTSVSETNFSPKDLPLHTVPKITSVGSYPVYYESPYDIALTQPVNSPLTYLNAKEAEIKANGAFSGKERSLELDRLKAVKHDITALINDAGGEEELMSFIAAL